MKSIISYLCVFCVIYIGCFALDNGVARTPPMGFNTWQRFRCNLDCEKQPDMCISEKLYKSIADAMVDRGFKDAGYEYINIDDCWMEPRRAPYTNKLVADKTRFPNGIAALSQYMHDRGLKLGLYQDIGKRTCIGFLGSEGYEEIDANTFADWNIDYIKIDGCNQHPKRFDVTYPKMGEFLNQTRRKMVYSCSWPYYQFTTNISIDYSALSKKCNLWRNYHDIQDYFGPGEGSIVDIVNWYGENRGLLAKFHGPGMWNDPDMMIVGDFGLSYDQSKAHMALWAILAAPLLVSADIRTMKQEYVDILLNRDIIAVDQDELGIMGFRHEIIDRIPGFGCYLQVWKREITPTAFNPVLKKRKYSYAVVFWNLCPDGAPIEVERTLFDLDAHDKAGYYVRDLFAGKNLGHFFPSDKLRLLVNPSGGVVMLKLHLAAAGEPKWANPVQSRWILFLPLDNAADVMLVLFMCCFMLLMLMVVFPFTRRCLFRLMRRLSK